MYSNPMQFYDFLQNQIKVLFKPRYEDVEYKQEFEVTLSKKMTYDMVSRHPSCVRPRIDSDAPFSSRRWRQRRVNG